MFVNFVRVLIFQTKNVFFKKWTKKKTLEIPKYYIKILLCLIFLCLKLNISVCVQEVNKILDAVLWNLFSLTLRETNTIPYCYPKVIPKLILLHQHIISNPKWPVCQTAMLLQWLDFWFFKNFSVFRLEALLPFQVIQFSLCLYWLKQIQFSNF